MSDPGPTTSGLPGGPRRNSLSRPVILILSLIPILLATLYQLDTFDPSPYPHHEFTTGVPTVAPLVNANMVRGSELIGTGELPGPEDIVFDADNQVIYTGCADGWIKRIKMNDSVADMAVEKWVNTGGRPLGLALDRNKQLIVGDADKGLLKISEDGSIDVLTDEAEGIKFKLTDGVDIADDDGIIYFTDASYKYSFAEFIWDILEGKPNGRLLSFDPSTKLTKLLVSELYFANGVTVSPDQNSVIFCETPMKRCSKYNVAGKKKGTVEKFIDNLPGIPDNIHYDGEGHYWIAFSTGSTWLWDQALKYPFLRKVMGIMERYSVRPHMEKNSGVMMVDLKGKPVAHYYDSSLTLISTGVKIGHHVYCGSIAYPFILRLNLSRYPAVAAAPAPATL